MPLLVHRVVFACFAVTLAACQEAPPLYPATAPAEVREACALTQRKCTLCHDRDRIVDARHNVTEWRNTIERMRRFGGSGISPADGEIILKCLSYTAESTLTPISPEQHALAGPSCLLPMIQSAR